MSFGGSDKWHVGANLVIPADRVRDKLRGSCDFFLLDSHIKRNFDPVCHFVIAINDHSATRMGFPALWSTDKLRGSPDSIFRRPKLSPEQWPTFGLFNLVVQPSNLFLSSRPALFPELTDLKPILSPAHASVKPWRAWFHCVDQQVSCSVQVFNLHFGCSSTGIQRPALLKQWPALLRFSL